jgi:hypothetical protein
MKLKRRLIAAAFRSMAGGTDQKSAYANAVAFYRATKFDWAKTLG